MKGDIEYLVDVFVNTKNKDSAERIRKGMLCDEST